MYIAQYPVTKHNGKEYEKEYMCVCVSVCIIEPLCWTEAVYTAL